MAKDDLALGSGLIRKGEAKGLNPALANGAGQGGQQSPPAPAAAPVQPIPEPTPPPVAASARPQSSQSSQPVPEPVVEDDPPLRASPPDDVAKRFTSFRLPVPLDEDLRAMVFETRRSKQDLLIDFVTAGVQAWRRDRARRG